MNYSLYSSFGFFLLALKAKRNDRKDVMWGCVMCGISSVLNHWHETKHAFYRPLDLVLVNATGLYFVNKSRQALLQNGYSKEHAAVLVMAIITLVLYFSIPNHLYFIVHLSAFTGIWFSITSSRSDVSQSLPFQDHASP